MKHNNKQPNGKSKKAFSVGMAAVLALLGIGGYAINNLEKPIDVPAQEDTQNDLELTEDFDINDANAVRQRAEAIYKISEKQIEVEEIMNIIYYFNGKFDSLELGLTDEEKVNTLKIITGDAVDVLEDNISDDVDVLTGNYGTPNEDSEIYSYMFLAGGEDKTSAIDLATLVKQQLDNIKNGNTNGLSEVAEKYYSEVMSIKNNTELSDGSKTIILLDTKTKNAIMSVLSAEKYEQLDKDYYNSSLNKLFFDALEKLGLEDAYNKMLDEARENGTLGNPITNLEETYRDEHAKAAVNHPAIKDEPESTTVVDNGGDKVNNSPGKQEEISTSEPTTKVEKETWTEEVPTGKVEITNPSSDNEEEEEFEVVIPEDGGYVEIVIPGGEVVDEYDLSERYVDAHAQASEDLAKTFK